MTFEGARSESGPKRDDDLRAVCTSVDQNADMIPLITRPQIVAYRTDKTSPTLYTVEGYDLLWRNIAEYRALG